jgi:hypothetical protein
VFTDSRPLNNAALISRFMSLLLDKVKVYSLPLLRIVFWLGLSPS